MKRHFRIIRLGASVYEYFIGRSNVLFKLPSGQRRVVDFATLTGRSWATIERGHWKRTDDGMITPAAIKAYILRAL